ncbi:hypothetical protein C8Q79DRAFT_486032 [Trametes meyenii]|nr:hypothetical protein C8Q79DRAFT_486032 [Trametes meyenii]
MLAYGRLWAQLCHHCDLPDGGHASPPGPSTPEFQSVRARSLRCRSPRGVCLWACGRRCVWCVSMTSCVVTNGCCKDRNDCDCSRTAYRSLKRPHSQGSHIPQCHNYVV